MEEQEIRVIIAGGRDFKDYSFAKEKIGQILKDVEGNIVIISGGASGADYLGEKYAKEHGLGLYIIPAKWSMYGRSAGPKRNQGG